MNNSNYKIRTVVLRPHVDHDDASQIIDSQKTSAFRSLLQKPKKNEVHVHSVKLNYESFLILSGKYDANYYRKKIHTINVDSNVKEVIVGDGIFPIKKSKGIVGKFGTKIKTKTTGKNQIDLELEEHVFLEQEQEIAFDHHGKEIKMPYKISSETIESYPKRILQKTIDTVKKPEITYDAAVNHLISRLKKSTSIGIRGLQEKTLINEIIELYVPIYEARLIGPRKKVQILRIDGIRKKVL